MATITYDLVDTQYYFQANTSTSGDQLAPDVWGCPTAAMSSPTTTSLSMADSSFSISTTRTATSWERSQRRYLGSTEAAGAPTLTEMSNGNVVVIWDDELRRRSRPRWAPSTRPSGQTVVPEFEVTTVPRRHASAGDCAEGEDGGFVVVNQHGSGKHLHRGLRRKRRRHSRPRFQIDGRHATGSEPVVTGLADGGFVVTWTRFQHRATTS